MKNKIIRKEVNWQLSDFGIYIADIQMVGSTHETDITDLDKVNHYGEISIALATNKSEVKQFLTWITIYVDPEEFMRMFREKVGA